LNPERSHHSPKKLYPATVHLDMQKKQMHSGPKNGFFSQNDFDLQYN